MSNPSATAGSIGLAQAIRSCQIGVAQSQLFMGRWTKELYDEKVAAFESAFRAELDRIAQEEKLCRP